MRRISEKIVPLPQISWIMADLFGFTYNEKRQMADQTAQILEEEIGLKGDAIQAVHLIPEIEDGRITIEEVEEQYGPQELP